MKNLNKSLLVVGIVALQTTELAKMLLRKLRNWTL